MSDNNIVLKYVASGNDLCLSLTDADVLIINRTSHGLSMEYFRKAYPNLTQDVSRSIIDNVLNQPRLSGSADTGMTVNIRSTAVLEFELDKVDQVVLHGFLYRNCYDSSPSLKGVAIKYMRARYGLGLREAKDIVGAVMEKINTIFNP